MVPTLPSLEKRYRFDCFRRRRTLTMGSPNNKPRAFTSHTHHGLCTRTHQIAALALIIVTFFLTRLLDQSFSPCASQASVAQLPGSRTVLRVNGGGSLSWPERGYGSQLSLKIYVYEEDEIDGLKSLLYGRDGSVPTEVCVTGQWGTQVFSCRVSVSHLIVEEMEFLFLDLWEKLVSCGLIWCPAWFLGKKVRWERKSLALEGKNLSWGQWEYEIYSTEPNPTVWFLARHAKLSFSFVLGIKTNVKPKILNWIFTRQTPAVVTWAFPHWWSIIQTIRRYWKLQLNSCMRVWNSDDKYSWT